jgi:hypothetical protein
MSRGSSDEAVLAISHHDAVRKVAVLDLIISQTGKPPFNPRHAIKKFAGVLKDWARASRQLLVTPTPDSRSARISWICASTMTFARKPRANFTRRLNRGLMRAKSSC